MKNNDKLNKLLQEQLIKDKIINSKLEELEELNLKIVNYDIEVIVDYEKLEAELDVNFELRATNKMLKRQELELIEIKIKDFTCEIIDIEFIEKTSKRQKRIIVEQIENKINSKLEELKQEYIKLLEKINDLLEKSFAYKKESKSIKDKTIDFIKSYKARREQDFAEYIILVTIEDKRKDLKVERNKLRSELIKEAVFDNRVDFKKFRKFYKLNQIVKEKDKRIKKLLSFLYSNLEEIVKDKYEEITLLYFAELQKSKYTKEETEIHMNKTLLIKEVYKELTPVFLKFGLEVKEFQGGI